MTSAPNGRGNLISATWTMPFLTRLLQVLSPSSISQGSMPNASGSSSFIHVVMTVHLSGPTCSTLRIPSPSQIACWTSKEHEESAERENWSTTTFWLKKHKFCIMNQVTLLGTSTFALTLNSTNNRLGAPKPTWIRKNKPLWVPFTHMEISNMQVSLGSTKYDKNNKHWQWQIPSGCCKPELLYQ